jgi:hypothetical protein
VELSFRIKFSLSRKLSGYELPYLKAAFTLAVSRTYAENTLTELNFFFTYVKLQKIQAWKLECEKAKQNWFQEKRKKQNVNLN